VLWFFDFKHYVYLAAICFTSWPLWLHPNYGGALSQAHEICRQFKESSVMGCALLEDKIREYRLAQTI
jgi:hypothetical protein